MTTSSRTGKAGVDSLIAALPFEPDGDLRICPGVAYQAEMRAGRVDYDEAYFAKVCAYEGGEIARAVNAGRCALLARHLPPGARVLDWGAGSGAFMREARAAGFEAHGFDVIEETARWLRATGAYSDDPGRFDALTAWDVLEHMEDPAALLAQVRPGALIFVSIPVFADLRRIRASRHYRPGEHLYYFTPAGFQEWAARRGLELLEASDHETRAGRDSVGAFAFRRAA